MSRFIIALFVIFSLVGCGSTGGTQSASVPNDPPVTAYTDYAKSWRLVVDGNDYSTIVFNNDGTMTSNNHSGWSSGYIEVTGPSQCKLVDAYTNMSITAFGELYSDKTSVRGTYTTSTGGSGNWCMSVTGYPYATNANMVGTWDMVINSQNLTMTFDANGNITACSDPNYSPGSGKVKFLGGMKIEIRATASGVVRVLTGQINSSYTIVGGSYNGSDGSSGSFGGSKIPSGAG